MLKAVLFDMDGVITNTEKLHYLAWERAFKEVGYNLEFDEYEEKLQSRNRVVAIKNVLSNPSERLTNQIIELKSRHYEELIRLDVEIYEDTVILLNELKQTNLLLAVVSSSSYAERLLDLIDLRDRFSLVVAGTNGLDIRNKPSPDIYLHAMDQLGVNPNECVVIEDSVSGITSGLASGAFVIGIERNTLNIDSNTNLVLVDKLHINQIKKL